MLRVMDTLLWIIAGLLVIVGIAGTVLPALPGTILVFGGLLMGAWLDDFNKVGGWPLTAMGVLTLLSFLVDVFSAAFGAKSVEASKEAFIGATIGTFIGIFFGLPGVILGPLVGAAAGEYKARKDVIQAGRAGIATWLGIVVGTGLKLGFAFLMVGLFVVSYLWN